MYDVDDKDEVVELPDVPQSSVGAPVPLVMSDEYRALVAYYMQNMPAGWDGTSVNVVSPSTDGEPVAIVTFQGYAAYMFGPPNDEAFAGHPLASRGLHPYGAFEVKRSSWVRQLARMNSVHEHHKPDHYRRLRHIVLAFHDSTFECACSGVDTAVHTGSIEQMIPEMKKQLRWPGAG